MRDRDEVMSSNVLVDPAVQKPKDHQIFNTVKEKKASNLHIWEARTAKFCCCFWLINEEEESRDHWNQFIYGRSAGFWAHFKQVGVGEQFQSDGCRICCSHTDQRFIWRLSSTTKYDEKELHSSGGSDESFPSSLWVSLSCSVHRWLFKKGGGLLSPHSQWELFPTLFVIFRSLGCLCDL